MKYIRLTFSYLTKNWWRMLIPLLPIAVCAGFFIEPYESASALYDVAVKRPNGFDEIAKVFHLIPTWQEVLFTLLTIVVGAVFISYSFIAVYRHFRTGKFSIRTPLPYINSGILPVLKIILIITASVVLYRVVIVFVIVLFNMMLSALHVSYVVTMVFVYVLVIAGCLSGTVLLSTSILVFPQMYVYGYSLVEAWKGMTNMITEPKKLFVPIIVPMLLLVLANYVFILTGAHFAIVVSVRSVLYLIVLAYYIVLAQTIMFAESGFERRDMR